MGGFEPPTYCLGGSRAIQAALHAQFTTDCCAIYDTTSKRFIKFLTPPPFY